LGKNAGQTGQGTNAVALGEQAGNNSQGANAVAIGYLAGQTGQRANSIVVNAQGTVLNAGTTGACYVAPIRNASDSYFLFYNPTSKEITYESAAYNNTSGGVNATASSWSSVAFFPNLPGGTYLFASYGYIDYAISGNATYQARFANITDGTTFTTHTYWGTLVVGLSRQPVSLTQVLTFTGTKSIGPQVYHDASGTVLFYLNTSYQRLQ
jgi:hypothetical protein